MTRIITKKDGVTPIDLEDVEERLAILEEDFSLVLQSLHQLLDLMKHVGEWQLAQDEEIAALNKGTVKTTDFAGGGSRAI